jgi:hypothetical protein
MKSYGKSCRKLSQFRRATDQPVTAATPWFKGGGAGWLVIAALVVAWDTIAPETLSAAFRRARSGPIGATIVVMGWACVTGHLFHVIPDRADPIAALCTTGRRAVKRGGG